MPSAKHRPGKFDFAVRRASAGRGLFTRTAIPNGACVIEYTGRKLKDGEDRTSRSKFLFDLGNDTTIDGWIPSNTARYVNHSCRPNCEATVHRGRVWIHAIRNIKPGDELTYDYGKVYFKAYIGDRCRCVACVAKAAKVTAAKPPEAKTPATRAIPPTVLPKVEVVLAKAA